MKKLKLLKLVAFCSLFLTDIKAFGFLFISPVAAFGFISFSYNPEKSISSSDINSGFNLKSVFTDWYAKVSHFVVQNPKSTAAASLALVGAVSYAIYAYRCKHKHKKLA